ncbi:MAG: hypothetical protein ACQERE_06155 [Pseudomonadota bacterium]
MHNRLRQAGKRLIARLAGRQRTGRGGTHGELLLAVLILMWPVTALPEPPTTVSIAPTDHPRYEQVKRLLTRELGDAAQVRAWSSDVDPNALVVTLNRATLSEIRANRPKQPVLSLFTGSRAIESIITDQDRFSALYPDPPLLRQARLGRLIIPRANAVAILASPEEAGRYSELRDQLREIGLESRVFVISSQDELIRHLARALSYGDFLLGTPDPRIFNRQTVKPLLLTSYRSNRLVVGPSRAFVNAGSVASTYTRVEDQIREAGSMIRHWLDHRELVSPRHPKDYSVAVNEQVARSMDLLVPPESELRKTLRRLEDDS